MKCELVGIEGHGSLSDVSITVRISKGFLWWRRQRTEVYRGAYKIWINEETEQFPIPYVENKLHNYWELHVSGEYRQQFNFSPVPDN